MNWSVFWRLWRVRQTRYTFTLMCPWFAIQIATGWTLGSSLYYWRGVSLCWGHAPGWHIPEGSTIYLHVDDSLVQRRTLYEVHTLQNMLDAAERTNVLMHNFIVQMVRANETLAQIEGQAWPKPI